MIQQTLSYICNNSLIITNLPLCTSRTSKQKSQQIKLVLDEKRLVERGIIKTYVYKKNKSIIRREKKHPKH